VTCSQPQWGDQLISDPLLIVEILSPGTAMYDRQTKVSDYRCIPSVREILLIDLREHLCRGIAARRRPLNHRNRPPPTGDAITRLDRADRNHVRSLEGIDLPDPIAAIP
jgi:Uma2 family endonuclease